MRLSALLILAALGVAAAQQPPPPLEHTPNARVVPVPAATLSSRLLRMSASNEALLQMAQIGEKRGATAAVRRYARRVALDQGKGKTMLQEEAKGLGINLQSLGTPQNQPAAQPTLQQINSATPADFDHVFLTAMASASEAFLPLLQQGARSPGAGSLQLLMRKLAALVQIHLTLAQELLKPGAPA